MLNVLTGMDLALTQFIIRLIPHNFFFDFLFAFFSLRGNSILIWIVLIVLAIVLEERKHSGIQKKDIQFVTTFIICFLVTSLLVNVVLKNVIQRVRPMTPTPEVGKSLTTVCPTDFSFPSGHASSAFAAAAVLSAFDKKRKWLYLTIAGMIGLSRIYLGCHYFFDVTFGALLGYLISLAVLKWSKKLVI